MSQTKLELKRNIQFKIKVIPYNHKSMSNNLILPYSFLGHCTTRNIFMFN